MNPAPPVTSIVCLSLGCVMTSSPRLCGKLGRGGQKWFVNLFARGKSPKVPVLEATSKEGMTA